MVKGREYCGRRVKVTRLRLRKRKFKWKDNMLDFGKLMFSPKSVKGKDE